LIGNEIFADPFWLANAFFETWWLLCHETKMPCSLRKTIRPKPGNNLRGFAGCAVPLSPRPKREASQRKTNA
jgi:hypothetical protein